MLTRRSLLIVAASATAAAAIGYQASRPSFAGSVLDAPEAHARSTSGALLLIDIRRPDEWRETGVAQGAHALDMRHPDFLEQLATLAGGDRTRPIALICARGVRSARLAAQLSGHGFTRIINVPEGMLGSASGPGWIARGLPVTRD